jgi:hypothetical protein
MRYRLPWGGETKSVREYQRAWRRLAAPIEKALEVTLYGYNPGLAFDIDGRRTWLVPADLAAKLGVIINGRRKKSR